MKKIKKIVERFPLRQIIKNGYDSVDTYDLLYAIRSDADIAQLEACVTEELRRKGSVVVTIKHMIINNEFEVNE